jgi:diguanylate cyclase (GGDEF)-like protein/PAS domain S-box-containing protein
VPGNHGRGRRGPTVGALAVTRSPIPAGTPCVEVERAFRALDATSVVVALADGPTLLNRYSFYQALVGPRGFGWALFHRKPVSVLPVRRAALRFAADDDALDAGLLALSAPGVAAGEDALVVWPDGTTGTVPVAALFDVVASDQRAQAEEVAAADARFKALVEHLSDIICTVGPDGTVRYLSPSYSAVVGRDASHAIGLDAAALVHPDDRAKALALLERCGQAPGVPMNGELRVVVSDGSARLFEVVARDLVHDPMVEGVVMTWRDVTQQRELEERLRHDALHDALTGVGNRTLMRERCSHALARLVRSGGGVAMVFVDLDGFKNINDLWGHDTGDTVLRGVAATLVAAVRADDTVARLGGDEFAVLLEDITATEAMDAAARLQAALRRPVDGNTSLRASIGVAVTVDPSVTSEELQRRADLAMYTAKNRRAQAPVAWDEELDGALLDDQQLAADLRDAITAGALHVAYQPIVDMGTGRTEALEALCRWEHPVRGTVAPGRFIPLAERSGLIGELGSWVLGTAVAQAAAWMRARVPVRVSVNVSGRQLSDPAFASEVQDVLASSRLPAGLLELEITETALVANIAEASRALRTLKQLGVGIAIDDFGTGYSSLAYLSELPVNTVKIDKSFVDRLGTTTNLIEGVVRLAHSLSLRVVAEGVEGTEQDGILRSLACDSAQGYLYARPAAASEAWALSRPAAGVAAVPIRT